MTVICTWVPMLDSDLFEAAEEMERELGGLHFWDGEGRAAAAFAAALGAEGQLAWDAYLYYHAGATWREPAPAPADWAHQLGGGSWAGPARFAWGGDVSARMLEFATMSGGRRAI